MNSTTLHSPSAASAAAALARHKELVHTTQKWVAQSFYGTLLKQMRQDPFRSELFDGGRGGQVFTEMFDQQISERMARGAPNGLVNSIVRKIEGNKASANYLRQSRPTIDDPRGMELDPIERANEFKYGRADVAAIG
ncbi:MAG: rod-binding protein [Tepidisphaeraceae bacterium]|jgi:Rod binding domain-containing protein